MMMPQIRARLQEQLEGDFATIEGAMDLAMLKGNPSALPAAYVLAAREASAENTLGMGAFRQEVALDFVVVIVTDDVSDPRGEAAGDAVDLLKAKVRRALVGWEPDGAITEINHVAGDFVTVRDGVVWWQETFATSYFLRAEL